MLDFRPVLFVCGSMILCLAVATFVPVAVDLATSHTEWRAFTLAALVGGFLGLAMMLSSRNQGWPRLRGRDAFLATVGSWIGCVILGALPFAAGSLHLSFTDALFESMSGLTTTGATILRGLDQAPRAVLIWRALLNWLGGIGVIVTALVVLPALRIGGMQLFAFEGTEEETPRRRVAALVGGIASVYAIFTLILGLAFGLAGMGPLAAACQAMSALSTGGFATSDRSFGEFGEAARWIAILGMIIGGTTFSSFLPLMKKGDRMVRWDSQIKRYLLLIGGVALLLGIWNWRQGNGPLWDSLEDSLFDSASVITTTGFHRGDYSSWSDASQVAYFLLAMVGACTGAAAGGIKIFRIQVLFSVLGVHMRRLLHPHGVFVVEYNDHPLPEMVIRSVLGFVMLYLICAALLALGLALTGLDAETSLSSAVAALSNLGPGLGRLVGPGGNYEAVPIAAKWMLTAGMLVGRLEIATVLALFTRSFWKR